MSEISQRIAKLPPEKRKLLLKKLQERQSSNLSNQVIARRPRSGPECLTPAQQRWYFLHYLEPENSLYNIPLVLNMKGKLDVVRLEKALNTIVSRHEILRTTFHESEENPIQLVNPVQPINLEILRTDSKDFSTIKLEFARRPFDLAMGPPVRFGFLEISPEECCLLSVFHHIAADGWSLNLFQKELIQGYLSNLPIPEELPIQYGDFAYWQERHLTQFDDQLTYWKKKLEKGNAPLDLPTDRPRPLKVSYQGSRFKTLLSPELIKSLEQLGKRYSATLFMVLMSALNILLARYSRQKEISIGFPIAGREKKEVEHLIGVFNNTLVLRSDLSNNPTFVEFLLQVQKGTLEAYSNRDVPFEKLIEELRPERSLSHSHIFQVFLVLQNQDSPPMLMEGISVERDFVDMKKSPFDLTFYMHPKPYGLSITLEYSSDLFNQSTIERMAEHFKNLLESIVDSPKTRIWDLDFLPEKEKKKLLLDWNDTSTDYPIRSTVHWLISEQAQKTPLATAIEFYSETCTYAELEERSNCLAHHLRSLGLSKALPVGILLERSTNMVVAMLGIMKAGGYYIPLDPYLPSDRLAYMVEDASIQYLISQSSLKDFLPSYNLHTIFLDTDWPDIKNSPSSHFQSTTNAESIAYVIYTSDSTGPPKGVIIQQKALVNVLCSIQTTPGIKSSDRLLALTTLSFDIAGLELYLPLISGACVVIVKHEEAIDGHLLAEKISSSRATLIQATPATWRMLIKAGWGGDRALTLFCGREVLSPTLAKFLFDNCGALWNMYGTTETAIWSTIKHIDSPAPTTITVGRPIANTTIYLLDERRHLVPIGVPGEVCIGGIGLAKGYFGKETLTKELFIEHPFLEGQLLYRTGDLGKYHPDGQIEVLGRLDHQVKVRGFKIELSEIEAVLSQISALREVVVIASDDSRGEKRLVAYFVQNEGQKVKISDLKSFLRDNLPAYMIPEVFVSLEVLPLTPYGKVDRKALPDPHESNAEMEENYIAPKNEIEIRLLKIWEEILDRTGISTRDSFFDLGGYSLLAVRLLSQIKKEFGKKLPMTALYEGLTIERLAILIQKDNVVSSSSLLVPIQTKGAKPPFFFTGLNGGYLPRNLSRCLGKSQPFYALLSESLEGKVISHSTVEEMAAHLISEIRTVQTDGPYMLGGFCAQAVVVFEMAHQLLTQGQKVGLLAIFEQKALGKRKLSYILHQRVYRDVQRIKSHVENLLQIDSNDKLNYVKDMVRNFQTRTVTKIRRQIAKKNYKSIPEFSVFHVKDDDRDRALRSKLRESYVPKIYPGLITLFVGSNVKYSHDPQLGWGELATDGVNVQVVEGNHTDMLREPHVQTLADKLTVCLEKAQAGKK